MASVIKIDNSLEKRFSQQSSKKTKRRDIVAYFLIVCEGEKTEPNYFKSFPKKVGSTIFNIECDGGGISTLKVVETAIELRANAKQKYDRVWAVFDRDSFEPNSFDSAILKADAKGIYCAWSNEAFELWYLLHFYNRNTGMKRDQYKNELEKAINKKIGNKKNVFEYKKNDENMYSMLAKYGNQDMAIKWARELNNNFKGKKYSTHNPATQVYKLVEELTGKSEKLNQEILEKFNNGE